MNRSIASQQCWIQNKSLSFVMFVLFLAAAILVTLGEGAAIRDYISDNGYRDDLSDLIDGFLAPKAGSGEVDTPGVVPIATKSRTEIMQLYQAILQASSEGDIEGGERDGTTGTERKKRPSSGLLGIDNLDFAASTLDKARTRVRLPMESQWQMARKMSKQIYTQPSSSTSQGGIGGGLGGAGGMSMSLSVGDMRRMLDMMKAGR